MPVGQEIEVPISLLATKSRSSLKGAVLGRVVLLQSSARDGGGACRNKPGEKKKRCGAADEKYLSSKDRNGKDIRGRTDCSIP